MTQQNDLPTAALTTAGEKLARLGLDCPWVGDGADVDIKNGYIYDEDPDTPNYYDGAVENNKLIAAAVVWYQDRLNDWLIESSIGMLKVRKNIGFESEKFGEYTWEFFNAGTLKECIGHASTRLSAAAALIIAVADTLEGE